MPAIETLKKLGQSVLDLVFPISCLVCGVDGTYLCNDCLAKLPRQEKQICLVCQTPAPFGKTHPNCVMRNSVDGAIAGLTYKDKRVQRIIDAFKYNFVSDLSKPLSSLIIEAISNQGLDDYFKNFIIVPVPLHTRRFNWRGFNQSELLSQALSEKLSIPIENQLVIRKKFTQPQTTLTANERKRNLENAFELSHEVTEQKILLVDDVVTSGATANELAKLFKKSNAAEIWIVSAAHG